MAGAQTPAETRRYYTGQVGGHKHLTEKDGLPIHIKITHRVIMY